MLFGINHYASTTVLTFCDRIWRAGCVLTLPAHAGGCITVKKKVEKRKDEIRKIAAMATTKIPAKKSKWFNQVVIGERGLLPHSTISLSSLPLPFMIKREVMRWIIYLWKRGAGVTLDWPEVMDCSE